MPNTSSTMENSTRMDMGRNLKWTEFRLFMMASVKVSRLRFQFQKWRRSVLADANVVNCCTARKRIG